MLFRKFFRHGQGLGCSCAAGKSDWGSSWAQAGPAHMGGLSGRLHQSLSAFPRTTGDFHPPLCETDKRGRGPCSFCLTSLASWALSAFRSPTLGEVQGGERLHVYVWINTFLPHHLGRGTGCFSALFAGQRVLKIWVWTAPGHLGKLALHSYQQWGRKSVDSCAVTLFQRSGSFPFCFTGHLIDCKDNLRWRCSRFVFFFFFFKASRILRGGVPNRKLSWFWRESEFEVLILEYTFFLVRSRCVCKGSRCLIFKCDFGFLMWDLNGNNTFV